MGSQFKGVLMLLGAAVVVTAVIGFIGRVVAPAPVPEVEPTPVAASPDSSQSEPTNPDAPVDADNDDGPVVGGTLNITGDRDDTLNLTSFNVDNAELSGVGGRLSFSRSGDDETIFVNHLVFDDLDIFLKPEDCSISAGDINTTTGIVPAEISCEAVTDIRDKATIDAKGKLALPGEVVMPIRTDLPPMGGTITVAGDYSLTISSDDTTPPDLDGDVIVGGGTWVVFDTENPQFQPTPAAIELANYRTTSDDEGNTMIAGTGISINQNDDTLWVGRIFDESGIYELEAASCPVQYEQVGVLGIVTTLQALSIDCQDVSAEGLGTLSITGQFNIVRRVISFR